MGRRRGDPVEQRGAPVFGLAFEHVAAVKKLSHHFNLGVQSMAVGRSGRISPSRMTLLRIKRGRCLTSSKIFAMYSPTSATAKMLPEPKNRIRNRVVVKPGGVTFGATMRKRTWTMASKDGERKEDDARRAEHVQRRVAEAEDALLGPADVLEQAVGRDAEHPLGPDVVDAGLLETGEGADTAEEQVALGELQQGLDDPLVHQREVAGVVRDADVGEIVEDPVKRLVGELHEQARLALDPAAVDDVVALAPAAPRIARSAPGDPAGRRRAARRRSSRRSPCRCGRPTASRNSASG